MYKSHVKRLLDIILAATILIATAPISLLFAALIKLESKGPVLFTQERTGLNGKTFMLRKFRSMTCDNDVRDLTKQNSITRVGKFLRKSSIDEIPQVINILRGEMSFIGPRPWIPEYFKHMNDNQRRRASVLPGITGRAQAYGRNSITINEKINHDLDYVEDVTLMNDIKLIFATAASIFDTSTHDIDKNGIQNELDTLQNQGDNSALVSQGS